MKNQQVESIISAGKKYIDRRFSVVPVSGKNPCIDWKERQEKALTAEEFEALVKKHSPTGLGIVCGKVSGIVVIDIDTEEGDIMLGLPRTPKVKTSRGHHHYFKYPEGGIKSSKPMPNVEIRSDGNIVVAPPSIHKSGHTYSWEISLDDCEMAKFPKEIFDAMDSDLTPEPKEWSKVIIDVSEGSRNTNATRLIGKLLAHLPEYNWADIAWNVMTAVNKCYYKPPLKAKELKDVFDSIASAERSKKQTADASSLKEITPAQCFIDDKAIMTIEFSEVHETEKGRQYARVPYLIINDPAEQTRKKIRLSQNEIIGLGYFSERTPDIQNRWSNESVKAFLTQKEEKVPTEKIFESVKSLYKEFSDFGDDRVSSLLACWVLGTYFHRMFNAYPYIHLNGHLQTGKSKTINLTTSLSFNGESNVGSTASYLVRSVHENCSTIGIDEAENLGNDDDGRILIQVLNAGYKLGTTIGKSVPSGNNGWKTKRFDPYSPKILGGIKRLAPTLNSRSIPITMLRSTDDKIRNIEIDFGDHRLQDIETSYI